jgi:hypothetical protein
VSSVEGNLSVIALALTMAGLVLGCGSRKAEPRRDPQLLDKIVHLPIKTLEVWFASVPRGQGDGLGPEDRTFVAVMRFETGALEEFVRASSLTEEQNWLPRHEMAAWFPNAVTSALHPLDARHTQIKGKCYDGTRFLRVSGPRATMCVLEDVPFLIFRRGQGDP